MPSYTHFTREEGKYLQENREKDAAHVLPPVPEDARHCRLPAMEKAPRRAGPDGAITR